MIKLEGSKFEPSVFYLLQSMDIIFLKENKIHEIFFASSPQGWLYNRRFIFLIYSQVCGLEVEKVKYSSNMIKLEGSKFEPSIFYLLESKDVIFLREKKFMKFFSLLVRRAGCIIGDSSSLYTARSAD